MCCPAFRRTRPTHLGQRLLGVGLGIALLAVADRVLWPAPAPADPAVRVADIAGRVAAYARVLGRELLDGGEGGTPGLRAAAADAADRLRLTTLPIAERPLGPGVRDRSLTRATAAIRVISGRLGGLADALPSSDGQHTLSAAAKLVDAVGGALTEAREALLGIGLPPSPDRLGAALAAHRERRRQQWLDGAAEPQAQRAGVTPSPSRRLLTAWC